MPAAVSGQNIACIVQEGSISCGVVFWPQRQPYGERLPVMMAMLDPYRDYLGVLCAVLILRIIWYRWYRQEL